MTLVSREPCFEAQIAATPLDRPCPPERGKWVLLATILGSAMAFATSEFAPAKAEMIRPLADKAWEFAQAARA